MSGYALQGGEGLGAALGDGDLGVAPFEKCGQGEDVAEVVVDDQDLRPGQRIVGQGIAPALSGADLGVTGVQPQRWSVATRQPGDRRSCLASCSSAAERPIRPVAGRR